jgi:MerR family transcriptional regulator, light-induced transcriptional regulator
MAEIHKYPIQAVSRATGLSMHVIRAWEKRYNAIEPDRTDTNRRLYSEQDIQKLRLLNDAIHHGHSISSVANLSSDELKKILHREKTNENSFNANSTSATKVNISEIISECIESIKNYDAKKFESLLLSTSAKLTQPVLIEEVIIPLVYKIGDLWHEGEIRVANEHLATSVIHSFLYNLLDSYSFGSSAPVIISATPRGQEHDLGALIVGVVAASSGWRVIYLGSNLPTEEISSAASQLNAKAVALSLVYPKDDPHLRSELKKLHQLLPAEVTLIVGGRAVDGYYDTLTEIGAVIVKGSKQFRVEIEAIRENNLN